MNMLNAWVNNTLIGLKLTFRDRQAIFWTYGIASPRNSVKIRSGQQ